MRRPKSRGGSDLFRVLFALWHPLLFCCEDNITPMISALSKCSLESQKHLFPLRERELSCLAFPKWRSHSMTLVCWKAVKFHGTCPRSHEYSTLYSKNSLFLRWCSSSFHSSEASAVEVRKASGHGVCWNSAWPGAFCLEPPWVFSLPHLEGTPRRLSLALSLPGCILHCWLASTASPRVLGRSQIHVYIFMVLLKDFIQSRSSISQVELIDRRLLKFASWFPNLRQSESRKPKRNQGCLQKQMQKLSVFIQWCWRSISYVLDLLLYNSIIEKRDVNDGGSWAI